MVGKKLAHYEILEPLGAGGMGEVYLAQDSRLGRKVAIKVLPAEFASDPQRLARFEQEARAAAALNHPHIAVVHDIGVEANEDGGDTHFMVQEYLEGQSLGERLEAGALPLDKALDLAIEVSEALIAAHRAGIIHRDLKPDNVFLTGDGHAKVLDFGLAKLTEVSAVPASASRSPTALGTVAGQIMGTAGYMAPEQVNGQEVDARADLFAFGCVLYEMVTGNRAFAGESLPDTLAKILHSKPSTLAEVGVSVPAELDRIVLKCLAKEPGERYQHADDLAVDLRAFQRASPADEVAHEATPGAAPPTPSGRLPVAAAGLACGLLIAATAAYFLRPPAQPPRLRHYDVVRSTQEPLRVAELSPDGSRVVYRSGRELLLRELDEPGPRRLLDAGGVVGALTWSPDGTSIAYAVGRELFVVDVENPQPLRITEAPEAIRANGGGIAWLDDGRVVFCTGASGLYVAPESGGAAELWLPPGEGEVDFHDVVALPGGRVLFETHRDLRSRALEETRDVDAFDGEQRRTVFATPADDFESLPLGVRYAHTGHLLFTRRGANGGIWAAPFSLSELRITGEARRLLPVRAGTELSVARSALLYEVRGEESGAELVWRDADSGSVERTGITFSGFVSQASLSPGGDRAVVVAGGDLWLAEPGDGTLRQLTFERSSESRPSWSADGDRIVYTRREIPTRIEDLVSAVVDVEIWIASVRGDVPPRRLVNGWSPLMAPDGNVLYFVDADGISRLPLTAGASAERVVEIEGVTVANDARGPGVDWVAVSPDGRLLAYQRREGGNLVRSATAVYVLDLSGEGEPLRVADGGNLLKWSREDDALFLYFLPPDDGDTRLARVQVSAGERLAVSEVTTVARLTDAPLAIGPNGRLLDIETRASAENPHRYAIVQDWEVLLSEPGSGSR